MANWINISENVIMYNPLEKKKGFLDNLFAFLAIATMCVTAFSPILVLCLILQHMNNVRAKNEHIAWQETCKTLYSQARNHSDTLFIDASNGCIHFRIDGDSL